MKTLIIIAMLSLCAGCGEPFAVGFGTGAAAMQAMADESQNDFIEAVNALNAETNRLNTEIGAVKEIDVEAFIKPETITAIKSLKGIEKKPTTWLALASILANGIWAGRTIEKRIAK